MDDYERRLLAAAHIVLSSDRRHRTLPAPSEIGVTAELKPYQIEGVSWLLSRFDLGVNVILGTTLCGVMCVNCSPDLLVDLHCLVLFGFDLMVTCLFIAGDEVSCC